MEVSERDTMKCSWCDELAISGFVGHVSDDGWLQSRSLNG